MPVFPGRGCGCAGRLAVLALLAGGCATSRPEFRCSASVAPGAVPGTYAVDFVVKDLSRRESPRVVAQTGMVVRLGQKGEVSAQDGPQEVRASAVVNRSGGRLEAWTQVQVWRRGAVVWTKQQLLTLSK